MNFKIVAVVKFNQGEAWVLNRKPVLRYERRDNLFVAQDGPIIHCLCYSSDSTRAFAGREFDITLTDGSRRTCKGDHWDVCPEELDGKKITSLTYGVKDRLRECYVYTGANIFAEEAKKLRAEYTGPVYEYWDYEKLIKYDSMLKKYIRKVSKLEKDKRHLIAQVKAKHKELEAMAPKYRVLQDSDCDWYWIPYQLVPQFKADLEEIEGLEYMDAPDKFDAFSDTYGKFQTGGAPDVTPPYFEEYESK